MKKASPYFKVASGLLAAWALCAPSTVHAWLLVVKNLTSDAMSVCYTGSGMGGNCFGSIEVPPYGTVPANMGTSCVGRWKVTRVRDGQALVLSRPTAMGCGDRRLSIHPDGSGFSLDAP